MPDDIKWPQKVTRYRIQCPFQRLLIAKHESQIDWSGHRIESGEALDRYLRQVMLPGLKDCITPDHPKSHYCKSIHLDRMLANPAPHINEARQIRQREGDEAARQFLLEHINRHKKEHFEGWWRYLMEENPLYAQHPAFQYLMLRPVLEGSTAKDTRTPLPVDAEALAHLFERMRESRLAPGTKLLTLLSQIVGLGAEAAFDGRIPSFGTDCRWVVVNWHNAPKHLREDPAVVKASKAGFLQNLKDSVRKKGGSVWGGDAPMETNACLILECTSAMHFSPQSFVGCGLDHGSHWINKPIRCRRGPLTPQI